MIAARPTRGSVAPELLDYFRGNARQLHFLAGVKGGLEECARLASLHFGREVSVSEVRSVIRAFGRARPEIDWTTVDWAEQNTVIARQVGCSREWVRQVRKSKNLPNSIHHGRQLSKVCLRLKRLIEKGWITDGQMTSAELGVVLQCRRGTASWAARKLNLKTRGIPKPLAILASFNWDLPNTDLGEIWLPHRGYESRNVAIAMNRKRLGHPAKWRRLASRPQRDPSYYAALEAEKAKAVEWKLRNNAKVENTYTPPAGGKGMADRHG